MFESYDRLIQRSRESSGVRSRLGQVESIRVMIDTKLLRACDRAAEKAKLSRSELVGLALSEYLQRARILESERRDQRGYDMMPQSQATEESAWEAEVVWPDAHS
jgi:metal-responsive CopG/Arc/MetJ family transcriptional regulator